MSVNVEWVGHACFRVWRDGGPVIVMDPYTPEECGLPDDNSLEGDTVIVSSLDDRAHGNPGLVRGNPRVINALEVAQQSVPAEVDGGPLITLAVAESPTHDRGYAMDNALYALEVGGVWVMHLGDLGYGLTADELAPFVDRCDVLLAIVGQSNTIPLEDLDFLIDFLKPQWVVPMHYRLAPIAGTLRPLGEFLSRRPDDSLIFARRNSMEFPLEIPGIRSPTIVVLQPSGYRPTGDEESESFLAETEG